MTHSHTPTPEWDTFGDTLRHMAQLPNPTPGPQRGYVDGYRDLADVHASVGADGWESLADQASSLKMLAAEVGYTHAYLEAYVASVDSIVALSRASIPAPMRAVTVKDLHLIERTMDASSPDEELAMKIAIGVVSGAMHSSSAPDSPARISAQEAEKVLSDHRTYLATNSILRNAMTSEQFAAYDEMVRKITSA